MQKNLAKALSDSISDEVCSISTNVLEIGLDAIMEDGILREIPIVSTAISVLKLGNAIHDRNYIKKLEIFFRDFNNGIVDEPMRQKVKNKLQEGNSDKEIEYLLLCIERYMEYFKPIMLSRLYLAYLTESINWNELSKYAAVIDRFLPGDYELLYTLSQMPQVVEGEQDVLCRLLALGLIQEKRPEMFEDIGSCFAVTVQAMDDVRRGVSKYSRTLFGEKLVQIVQNVVV